MVEAGKKKGGCCGGGGGGGGGGGDRPRQPEPGSHAQARQSQSLDSLADSTEVAKVVFVGDKSVGKTSIIKSFMENRSAPATQPTLAVSDFTKVMEVAGEDGKMQRVKLNIWDAAGDQNVHNIAHLFMRDVQVGILCYSIESMSSFNALDEWLEHI